MKTRWHRGLALLLTLFLLSGNLAFAEELRGMEEPTAIREETPEESELELGAENTPAPVRGVGDTIYLNGQLGDDTKDGSIEANAVRSFAKAKALAEAATNIKKIIVIGTVDIEDEITLDGTHAIVLRGEHFNDYVFRVPSNKIATLKKITIDGNSPEKWENSTIEKSLIFADHSSTLHMQDDAVIRNNKIVHRAGFTGRGGGIYALEATIDLHGGVIEDNAADHGGGIYLENATLKLSSGVIQNNRSWFKKIIEQNEETPKGGGIHASHSKIIMTGGQVEKNQGAYGGGICLYGSTMNFTGGMVQNNRAELVIDTAYGQIYSSGGGICAAEGSTIHMSGDAVVSKNFAHEVGGGISVGWNQGGDATTLYMSGGIIDGNEAGASGGGILIQAGLYSSTICKAYISAGKITNNRMSGVGVTDKAFGGGGIYVNGIKKNWEWQGHTYPGGNGELHLVNTVIRDNTALGTSYLPLINPDTFGPRIDPQTGLPLTTRCPANGGGYAACPISDTKIRVTDGVSIYLNKANEGGKDLYVQCSEDRNDYVFHYGNPTYELSQRMLGGAHWNWKQEDQTLLPLDKYTGQLQHKQQLALHTDFTGSTWVDELHTVLIAGNTSTARGGGIGSNGSVFFGTDGKTTEVTVEKQWEDEGNSGTRPKEVKVQLWAKLDGEEKEYPVAEETVTATQNWKVTFTKLQKYKYPRFKIENDQFVPDGERQKIIYTVKEVPVRGYTSEVTGDAEHGFTITNKRKPEKPPTPSERFIEIPVEKIWKDDGHKDKRPTEITVALYADGVATDKTLVLSAANEWKGVFRNLPEKKDGKVITYTVQEVEVKGYESVLTGNPRDGFVLTNTYKPEKPPTPPTPPTPPIPSIPFVRIPRAGA